MKWILQFFFCLVAFAHAADGDSLVMPDAEFIKVDDEMMEVLQQASCEKEGFVCSFPSNYVLFGSFTGKNRTDAIMLSGAPGDGPSFSEGELFTFIDNTWLLVGPFENDRYTFLLGNECRKITTSKGHELLLCECSFGKTYDKFIDGEYFPSYALWIMDFSKIPVDTILFSNFDMPGDSLFCADLRPNETFKFLDDVQLTFEDFNNDTNSDISIALRETEINSSNCADKTGVMKLEGELPVKHQLTWLFDGETFTPTPETKMFLETLQTQQ
jgi:hypothetical protein